MINVMFTFEFIFSVLILIFNGGSKLTYFKIPYKLYCAIPFPLEKKFILFLIPKFFRIDLIQRLFSLIEIFINTHVSHYILNYYLKSFVTYIVELFKVLLIFGLYAHCLCCFLVYFEGIGVINYLSGLYYSIQSFTTIGFGEQSPATKGGLVIMIINLFLGVNFMSVTTSNIRYLYNKIQDFNRETSFNEQFEFLVFQIQRSTGKVFPNHLKTLMHLFLLYRRGMAYYEIKNKNKLLFANCRQKVVNDIHSRLFNYLKRDFSIYFENCEDEFIFEIGRIGRRAALKGIRHVNIGKANILFEIVTDRRHIFRHLPQTVELIPAEQELCLFSRALQGLYNKITGSNITEISDMNRARGADSCCTHIFFLFRTAGNDLCRHLI